jgi:myo-inositol 2-dehydrogenase / D-chiro-inositol 1-dehydrogenase
VLRIGFIGTGVIAWAHSIGLHAMIKAGVIDANITAAYDCDQRRSAAFASAAGALAVKNLAEVLERCDAVWVCTPTACHDAAVELAVASGRAVFCEKPLAVDLARAEHLAAVVRELGAASQVGLVLRSTPVFRSLRDLASSEELGPAMSVVFRDDQFFPVQGHYASTWRKDFDQAGGGCLIEHSIHDLDILEFCLGPAVELSARTRNFAGHPGIEDVASVSLSFASGATAELTSVWHEILSRPSTRRVELFCRDGLVCVDNDYGGPLYIETSEGTSVRSCEIPDWVGDLPLRHDQVGLALRMYVEEDRAFVESVTGGRAPGPTFDDALRAHTLADAAYRSASAGGEPIRLS